MLPGITGFNIKLCIQNHLQFKFIGYKRNKIVFYHSKQQPKIGPQAHQRSCELIIIERTLIISNWTIVCEMIKTGNLQRSYFCELSGTLRSIFLKLYNFRLDNQFSSLYVPILKNGLEMIYNIFRDPNLVHLQTGGQIFR